MAFGNVDSELLVAVVSVIGVGVDIGAVNASTEEIEADMDTATSFIGNAANVPVLRVAVFTGNDVVFTNFAGKGESSLKISGDSTDKTKLTWKTLLIDKGAVSGHLHSRINRDKIGELASKCSGHTLDTVGKIEDATGVVHTAGEQSSVGQEAGVRRSNGAAFVFLATSAFARE